MNGARVCVQETRNHSWCRANLPAGRDNLEHVSRIRQQMNKTLIGTAALTLSWLELLVLPPSSHTQHVRCCGMRRAATARRRRRGRGRRLTAVG